MPSIDEILSLCETRIGYRFRDRTLLRRCLTHSSSAETRLDSNERLEFLGDAVLGLVIVEYLFGWSGLGALAIESVYKRDYAVLQGVVLLVAGIFIVTNLVVDLLYGLLDPRLRVSSN